MYYPYLWLAIISIYDVSQCRGQIGPYSTTTQDMEFTDEMITRSTGVTGVGEMTTSITSVVTDDTTSEGGTTEEGSDDGPNLITYIVVGVVGVLLIILVSVVVTLIIVKCCCSKNTVMCPKPYCMCCHSPPTRPPLPHAHEVNIRLSKESAKSTKDNDTNHENGENSTDNQNNPSYVNEGMDKNNGRAKANTYVADNQEIYHNVPEPETTEVILQPDDVTLEDDEYVNDNDEEGIKLKEIARGNTIKPSPQAEPQEDCTNYDQMPKSTALHTQGKLDEEQEVYANIGDAATQAQINVQNQETQQVPSTASNHGAVNEDNEEYYVNHGQITNPENEDVKEPEVVNRYSHASSTSNEDNKLRRQALIQSGVYGNQDAVDKHFTVVDIDQTSDLLPSHATYDAPKPLLSTKPSAKGNVAPMFPDVEDGENVYLGADTDVVAKDPEPQDEYTAMQHVERKISDSNQMPGSYGHSNDGYDHGDQHKDENPLYANFGQIEPR